MTKKKIIEMLKELVNEIDYDIYKDMFVYKDRDSDDLIKIVQKYIMNKPAKTK